MINNIVTINKIAAFAINFSFALIMPLDTVILGTTREEATIPYYAFRMKIKYALVKVLMLVGDVRNAMVAMGTSGTKDVLAHLPDDDALQAKDEVFRPIFSVPGRKVIVHF
jgi:hypothetical protein